MVTRLFLVCARNPYELKRFRELIAPHDPIALPLQELPSNLLFHWSSGSGPDETDLLNMAAGMGAHLCIFGIDPTVLVDKAVFGIASSALDVLHRLSLLRGSAQELVCATQPPISVRLVDRILDRITAVGLSALLPIERKALDRYAHQA